MKKILWLLILILAISGCGKVNKKDDLPSKEKNIEKYSLISTENRLVFKNGENYEIIYYENGNIIKVESAIKFDSESAAKLYFEEESYGSSDIIKYVYDVFIVEQTTDYWEDYKDLSPEELKEYYKKANFEYVS